MGENDLGPMDPQVRMFEMLARIDEKLTNALKKIDEHESDISKINLTLDSHGNRLTAIESASTTWRQWVPTLIAAIAAMSAVAVLFIT
jgi:hypothetical protein